MRALAGDIGGTKTWLAIVERDDAGDSGGLRIVRERVLASADHDSLTGAIAAFGVTPADDLCAATFAIAGPVVQEVVRTTNLPWVIEAAELRRTLGLEQVHLLNDFHAVALGLTTLGPASLEVLQRGSVDPVGPKVVLGAGTGLGKAVLVPGSSRPTVLSSEGGHSDFAPRDDFEDALVAHLRAEHGRVSVERVVSGLGLAAIYDFIVHTKRATTSDEVRAAVSEGDAGAVIAAHADSDAACALALTRFVRAYGSEAANLALEVLPTGGLYIAGGIAPKLLPRLRSPTFLDAYGGKGRMAGLLGRFQVAVVLDAAVGLRGAAADALTPEG